MMFPTLKETLKQTTSRCPTCQAAVPAEVWKTTGTPAKVYLTRTCTEHGEATACIASDARFYWLAKGDPSNACGAGCACSVDPAGINGTLGRNAGATVPEEIGFQVVAMIRLWRMRRKHWQTGQHFHLYLIGYGLFRFAHEFLRATPKPFLGLSGYQIIAPATGIAAALAFRTRSRPTAAQTMADGIL